MSQAWNEIQLFLRRHLSPGVMWIFLINIALFILYMLLTPFSKSLQVLFFLLMQTPKLTIESFFIWQPVTYMFMHADLLHLLFNMIILWFFASRLEDRWGTKRFLRFYFIVGIGAAFFHIMPSYLTGHQSATMLGASG
ncbi:MAG: rhomboid family intramembrane serine protease, partial [Candidatus Sumerlaeota bacterium]